VIYTRHYRDYPLVAYGYDDYDYVMYVDATGRWVWIPGYWEWFDGQWLWVEGYWTAVRVGYYWQPGYWLPTDGSFRRVSGRWIETSRVADHRRPRIEVMERGEERVPARRGGRW
jgi:hypothetical protein